MWVYDRFTEGFDTADLTAVRALLGPRRAGRYANARFLEGRLKGRNPCDEQASASRLIEQQIPRLIRYARALTRNRERADDDLVQDTLARALIKEQF